MTLPRIGGVLSITLPDDVVADPKLCDPYDIVLTEGLKMGGDLYWEDKLWRIIHLHQYADGYWKVEIERDEE